MSGGPGGLGAPVTIFGTGFGPSRGTSMVTIGGVEVGAYVLWGEHNANNPTLDMIVVQPGPRVSAGPIVVAVGGIASNRDVAFRPTNGHVYEVATTGVDTNDCAAARPCATISHLMRDVMRPGDVGLVRGGTYDESEVWIRADQGHSGTVDQPKTVAAYPGESAVYTNAARPLIVDADYITVAGLHFRNGKSTGVPDVGLPGHRNDRFINNTFNGTIGYSAIDLHGDNHVIAGNVCDVDASTVGTQGHCFYVSYGSGDRLLYNSAAGAPGYGIHVFDQQRSGNDFRRVISDILIEGNVLRGSTERSGLILAMGDEGKRGNVIERVVVRANTLTGNNHTGMVIGSNVHGVTITDNTFSENGRQGLTIADESTISDVTVTGNRFEQSANGVCRSNCSWYVVAHIQKGSAAQQVMIVGNRYLPMPPAVVGATDPAPAS